MKQGDLVVRKSYGGDVIFRIILIKNNIALLKGVDFRLLADATLDDLLPVEETRIHDRQASMRAQEQQLIQSLTLFARRKREKSWSSVYWKGANRAPFFDLPGKVLHLDGDPVYLRKSMQIYGQLRISADGFYVPEGDMPQALYRLLPQSKPDILVITGHDGMLKHREDFDIHNLKSYKNSQNFVNAVKVARQYEKGRDALTVIAGACQSHFEALLQSGANFASSPARVLIHALDPVSIATTVSYTPIKETIDLFEVISQTMSGIDGLGGIETKGCYRVGLPRLEGHLSKI